MNGDFLILTLDAPGTSVKGPLYEHIKKPLREAGHTVFAAQRRHPDETVQHYIDYGWSGGHRDRRPDEIVLVCDGELDVDAYETLKRRGLRALFIIDPKTNSDISPYADATNVFLFFSLDEMAKDIALYLEDRNGSNY